MPVPSEPRFHDPLAALAHRIREAVRDGSLVGPLGGFGYAVEAEETFIGRKEGIAALAVALEAGDFEGRFGPHRHGAGRRRARRPVAEGGLPREDEPGRAAVAIGDGQANGVGAGGRVGV